VLNAQRPSARRFLLPGLFLVPIGHILPQSHIRFNQIVSADVRFRHSSDLEGLRLHQTKSTRAEAMVLILSASAQHWILCIIRQHEDSLPTPIIWIEGVMADGIHSGTHH
jgi:hypothetical protein